MHALVDWNDVGGGDWFFRKKEEKVGGLDPTEIVVLEEEKEGRWWVYS